MSAACSKPEQINRTTGTSRLHESSESPVDVVSIVNHHDLRNRLSDSIDNPVVSAAKTLVMLSHRNVLGSTREVRFLKFGDLLCRSGASCAFHLLQVLERSFEIQRACHISIPIARSASRASSPETGISRSVSSMKSSRISPLSAIASESRNPTSSISSAIA